MRRAAIALALTAALGESVAGAASADRAADYVLHCAGCHGLDAAGTPGTTPGLHGLAPLAATDAGRRYLVRVPGVAQAPIDDAALAALLDWVLAAYSEGPPPPRFSPDEVGRLRARPLRDPVAARRALDRATRRPPAQAAADPAAVP